MGFRMDNGWEPDGVSTSGKPSQIVFGWDIRRAPVVPSWPIKSAFPHPRRKAKIRAASGESHEQARVLRCFRSAVADLLQHAPIKRPVPVLPKTEKIRLSGQEHTFCSRKLILEEGIFPSYVF